MTITSALFALLITAAPQAGVVTLGWDPAPASEKITGYLVGYAQVPANATTCPTNGDGDTFVPVKPPTATTFKITTLTPGKTYCFRVYSISSNGRSNASNTVGPRAIPGPPSPPDPLPSTSSRRPALVAPGVPPASPFTIRILFGPASEAVPSGFLLDSGAAFGDRGNGRSYGWNVDASRATRDRDPAHPGQPGTTFIHMQREPDGVANGVWEFAVPNGTYDVRLCAGDPNFTDSSYSVEVEDVLLLTGTPTAEKHIFEASKTVTVSDGRLTVRSGKGAVNNKLCWIAVTPR
jgi:hypothetical protein